MKEDIIEKLKELGFKEYESKVFSVLLKGSLMRASEIAKEAKIVRNSIYDILKSFVEKGGMNKIIRARGRLQIPCKQSTLVFFLIRTQRNFDADS